MVLKDKKLRYYKNENSKFAKGCINFEFYEVTIERSEKNPKCFVLLITGVKDRKFEFKAATVESATAWHTEILKHIGKSEGFL